MTTTGVNALSGAAAVGQRPKTGAKASGGGSFADMITANLTSQNARQPGGSKTVPSGRTEQSRAVEAGTKADGAQAQGTTAEGMQTSGTKAEGAESTAEAKLPGEAEAAEMEEAAAAEGMEAECEVAAKVLEDIRKAVAKALGLSLEELAGLMEQLGMTMVDLTNAQQLTQLTLAAAGETEFSVLLTDGELSGKLSGLLKQVQGILDEAEITPERLNELVGTEEFAQLMEGMPSAEAEIKSGADTETNVRSTGKEPLQETGEDAGPKPEEGTFRFEAVRETQDGQVSARREGTQQSDAQPGEGTQTQAEQFLNFMADSVRETDAETSFVRMDPAAQLREIADQLLEKVRVVVSPARTSMEITLTPESLGKVNLNIVSQHGAMTARFTAQTEIARQAIESQLVTLRENLEKQGLKVDAIEVTVSEFGFAQSDQAAGGQPQGERRQGRRSFVTEEADAPEGISGPESMPAGIPEASGSQVDYTA